MSKVVVFIEEHLCKEVEIDAPNELDTDEAMEYAEEKVKEMYKNEEIILTADDYNGNTLYLIKHEDGTETDWIDM